MPSTEQEQPVALNNSLQCSSCGATLHFAPGTHHLQCSYCGETNEIQETSTAPIVSFDYLDFIAGNNGSAPSLSASVVSCKNCGASTTLPPEVNSDNCAFCASPLVIADAQSRQLVRPHYVLPFLVAQAQALDSFRNWLKKLWWAPNDLTKLVSGDARQFKGIYIPHWSFDTQTVTDYSGSRGDYYYVTETYTETVDGQEVTRTEEVRYTSWTHISGRVEYDFTDLLISASNSLPQDVANRLEPWALEKLVHYNEQYVSGFRSEIYQIDAEAAFQAAQKKMEPIIREEIRADIGGDEQTIDGFNTTCKDIGLKYILLPAWISTYKYNNKLYHFTVNACTGEVVGERPYSAAKIAFTIIAVLILIIAIIVMVKQ